ncbi:hypothetical protein M1563_02175 [Patescibacteria group bacterium]|nr:hypothetical protein [Patescibacteria group bacterium]MCL5409641.1 hypothetical protein [Patescibacteria group bacterium]
MENLERLPGSNASTYTKLFLVVVVASIVFGTATGYLLASSGSKNNTSSANTTGSTTTPPSQAAQDSSTFRDFAEGVIQPIPTPSDPGQYVEGTHLLVRTGATPVTLTSSVVDLNQYNGKKVKVYGETQKALKSGWLMDVGKVEVEN